MVALALDNSPRRPALTSIEGPSQSKVEATHCARSMLALKDIYDAAGAGIVAGATNVDRGDLAKMFVPDSGRYFRYASVYTMGRFASAEQRRRIVEPLATCFGLYVTEIKPLTAEEKNAKLERVIAMLGPLAEALRDREFGVVPNVTAAADDAELVALRARNRALEGQIAAFQESFLGR